MASCAASGNASIRQRHAKRVYSNEKICAWSEGLTGGWAVASATFTGLLVNAWTLAMAAARKWPWLNSSSMGVSDAGCLDGFLNGGGTDIGVI